MAQKSGALRQIADALNVPKNSSIFSRSPKLRRAMSQNEVKAFGVAVIGCGIAGKVRIRDLTCNPDMPELNKVTLHGFVTRQDLQMVGVEKLSLDEVLKRRDINAVIICTENGRHESLARQSLEAGKHVLLEYPVATSGEAAQKLYALAEKKGLVLYEEDISLLTPAFDAVKQTVMNKDLDSADFSFSANYGHEWLDKFEESGSLLVSSINNLHWLVEFFGELTPISSSLCRSSGAAVMKADMETVNKRRVRLSITRDRSLTGREKKIDFRFMDGSKLDELPPLPRTSSGPGLFLRDFFQFHKACRGQLDLTAWNKRTLHSLQLCDTLNKMAGL